MSEQPKKMSLQEAMAQALAKKQQGQQSGSGLKTGVVKQGKMSGGQLSKKPSLKGRRMGV